MMTHPQLPPPAHPRERVLHIRRHTVIAHAQSVRSFHLFSCHLGEGVSPRDLRDGEAQRLKRVRLRIRERVDIQ